MFFGIGPAIVLAIDGNNFIMRDTPVLVSLQELNCENRLWPAHLFRFYFGRRLPVHAFLGGSACAAAVGARWITYFVCIVLQDLLFVNRQIAVMTRHVALWLYDCVLANGLAGEMASVIDVCDRF